MSRRNKGKQQATRSHSSSPPAVPFSLAWRQPGKAARQDMSRLDAAVQEANSGLKKRQSATVKEDKRDEETDSDFEAGSPRTPNKPPASRGRKIQEVNRSHLT